MKSFRKIKWLWRRTCLYWFSQHEPAIDQNDRRFREATGVVEGLPAPGGTAEPPRGSTFAV